MFAHRSWLPAAALASLSLVALLAHVATPRPDARIVATLVPPGGGIAAAAMLAERAQARLVAESVVPGIWLLAGDANGLAQRLRAAGAWVVFDPLGLRGCFTVTRRSQFDFS